MPNHYKKKKKIVRKNKKTQHGGQKKTAKKKICMCHQKGGMLLSPSQLKMLTRPVRKFKTLPVKRKQRGMGHGCLCNQCGGNIFGDIGRAFKSVGKSIVSNPLRAALALGSAGASELFLTPAQLIRDSTGVRASKVLDVAAPVIGAVGTAGGAPQLGLASKLTSKALKQMGLGRQPMLV